MQPFSIRIRKDQKARLNAIAEAQERTAHSLAVKALGEYIEREEARLDFKRETNAAWEHYQTTGLHVTLQEVGNWMDTLFTDNELPPPVCHK
jgi:predicted transcriptional regulator